MKLGPHAAHNVKKGKSITCSAELHFEHATELRCFASKTIAEHDKPIFDLLHVVVSFTCDLDFECVRDDLIMITLDVLMILIDDVVALYIFDQSASRKVELWVVFVLPHEQRACCTESVRYASAVDEDSHASFCTKRLDWPVFNEVAGKRGQTVES